MDYKHKNQLFLLKFEKPKKFQNLQGIQTKWKLSVMSFNSTFVDIV
jgi:hypothetical protein